MESETQNEMTDAEIDAFLKTSLLGPPTYLNLVTAIMAKAARPMATKEVVLAIEADGRKASTPRRLIMANVSLCMNKHPAKFRRVCIGLYEMARPA